MDKAIFVIKTSGDKVPFSAKKLRHSLHRAGATEVVTENIEREIEQLLYPGITTAEIYKKAFSLLRKSSGHLAARYKLKKAIQELGPSGFPFERYVSEILKQEGYQVQLSRIIPGHCVQHEVDVTAEKDAENFLIECKFHSEQKRKCDVKIPLYIHSRFLDVKKAEQDQARPEQKYHQAWIVTNTRFTDDAVQYGTCSGLNLISWNYPGNNSLKDRIDRAGLHPLTCLTTLTKKEKQILLDRGIVLCKEICKHEQWLKEAGVLPPRTQKVLQEAWLLGAPVEIMD